MTRDTKLFLWIAIGVILLSAGTATVVALTRGVRNKNPGNIEKGTAWKGLDTAATARESRFAVFAAPEWGFRAMARLLLNYFSKYNLNTVAKIIGRWSPSADPTNPAGSTVAYINSVARHLNVSPDAPINVPARLPELMDAMARFENAGYVYPPSVIAQGIALERSA